MSNAIDFNDAIQFIWREAEMLDRRDYENWLQQWTDDALYIVPVEKNPENYEDVLNYAYDNADMRRMRVARLSSKQSMSAVSAATTVRTVSRFVEVGQADGVLTLRAAQMLGEYSRGHLRMMPADIEAEIVRDGGQLKYKRKIVTLIDSEDGMPSIGYLL